MKHLYAAAAAGVIISGMVVDLSHDVVNDRNAVMQNKDAVSDMVLIFTVERLVDYPEMKEYSSWYYTEISDYFEANPDMYSCINNPWDCHLTIEGMDEAVSKFDELTKKFIDENPDLEFLKDTYPYLFLYPDEPSNPVQQDEAPAPSDPDFFNPPPGYESPGQENGFDPVNPPYSETPRENPDFNIPPLEKMPQTSTPQAPIYSI